MGAENGRAGGFFMLANDFARQTKGWNGTEFRVFLELARRADKDGHCFPPKDRMSQDLGLSLATIKRAIKRLVSSGALRVLDQSHGRISNTYEVSSALLATGSGLTPLPPFDGFSSEPDPSRNGFKTCRVNRVSSDPPIIPSKEYPSKNGHFDPDGSFDLFWSKVTRKVKKDKARVAWRSAVRRAAKDKKIPESEAADFIIERMAAYAKTDCGQAGKYCPHPSSWLNAGSYDDDPEEWDQREPEKPKPQENARLF